MKLHLVLLRIGLILVTVFLGCVLPPCRCLIAWSDDREAAQSKQRFMNDGGSLTVDIQGTAHRVLEGWEEELWLEIKNHGKDTIDFCWGDAVAILDDTLSIAAQRIIRRYADDPKPDTLRVLPRRGVSIRVAFGSSEHLDLYLRSASVKYRLGQFTSQRGEVFHIPEIFAFTQGTEWCPR